MFNNIVKKLSIHFLDFMRCTENSVNDLFSNADHINQSEIETEFNSIIKKSEKTLDLSGKY